MRCAIFRALLLAAAALPALPATLTLSQTTPGYPAPGQNIVEASWREDLVFPQFNPAVGELTGITLALEQALTTAVHLPVGGIGGTYTLQVISVVKLLAPLNAYFR